MYFLPPYHIVGLPLVHGGDVDDDDTVDHDHAAYNTEKTTALGKVLNIRREFFFKKLQQAGAELCQAQPQFA